MIRRNLAAGVFVMMWMFLNTFTAGSCSRPTICLEIFWTKPSLISWLDCLPGSACADGDEGCGERGRAASVTHTAQISTETTTTVSNRFRCMNPPLVLDTYRETLL